MCSIRKAITLLAMASLLLSACVQKDENRKKEKQPEPSNSEKLLKGDRTIYGLACEGCTDSVVVVLKEDGSDPVTYNTIDAFTNRKMLGRLKVGDWVAIVPNESDSTVADIVINLDELKGTWCYLVLPTLPERHDVTQEQRDRMMREMPDSVRKRLFAPREYGFTLKRQWIAQSVGYVRQKTSANRDRSPMVYPRLLFFTEWHILNGQLVMTSGKISQEKGSEDIRIVNNRNDTCNILLLRKDTLVLESEGVTRGYYRKVEKS